MSTDAGRVRSLFAPLLRAPGSAVVACDFDGTLAPIVEDPELAVPAPGAVRALTALAPFVGRLAVVTGRPAATAVRLGGLDRVPGLVVLGVYGQQRWEAGELAGSPPAAGVATALTEVRAMLAAGVGGPAAEGVWVEDKGGSFAVHVRPAADPEAALATLRDPLGTLADRVGLAVQPGRLVIELLAPGTDKGAALSSLAADIAPAPSAVLFAGDDLADLPAFAAVRSMRSRGIPGWAVAVASEETPEVAAQADLVVDGPAAWVRLLEQLAAELGHRPGSASSASS